MFDFKGIYRDTQKIIHKPVSKLSKAEMHELCASVIKNLKFESEADFHWIDEYIEKAYEAIPREVNIDKVPAPF